MITTNGMPSKTTPTKVGPPPLPTEGKTVFFPFGLPGFEHLQHFNIKPLSGTDQFFILQAVAEPAIALIVMDARGLGVYTQIEIPQSELQKVGIQNPADMALLVIIKIDREHQLLLANTKAPLIINLKSKKGVQVILDDEQLSTEYTLNQEN